MDDWNYFIDKSIIPAKRENLGAFHLYHWRNTKEKAICCRFPGGFNRDWSRGPVKPRKLTGTAYQQSIASIGKKIELNKERAKEKSNQVCRKILCLTFVWINFLKQRVAWPSIYWDLGGPACVLYLCIRVFLFMYLQKESRGERSCLFTGAWVAPHDFTVVPPSSF